MSSLSRIFEKPLSKVKNFFMNEGTAINTYKKKKSEEIAETSFGMVENHLESNEVCLEDKNRNKNNKNENDNSMISLYENEFSDFVVLEFGDAKIISKEEWLEIFKKKNLSLIPHKDIYLSLQKGICFLMYVLIFFSSLYFLFRRRNLWPLLANVEKLSALEKKTYRDFVNEDCEDDFLIQKDITRTYPDLPIFEKKSGQQKSDIDPFDYV